MFIVESVWAWWLVCIVVSFGVLEGIALINKRKGDTLSEYTRKWIGLGDNGWKRTLGAAAFAGTLLGFVTWFVLHIFGL